MDTSALTYWQRRHLERQLHSTQQARVYRRTLAVLEVASGQSVASVAARLRVTPRAVYNWLAAYALDHDPAALEEGTRSGRPTLLAQSHRDLLEGLLAASPQEHGYPNTTWTVPLLQFHLRQHARLSASFDTIRRELWRLRYSWKRPRYRLDPDPEARGKKDAYPQTHQAVATQERGAGAGRDGPAVVPASALVLVARGPAQGGRVERTQRPAGGVRGDQSADG